MKVFGIDTSGSTASCCLVVKGQVVAAASKETNMSHSRAILPMCVALLQERGLTLSCIDKFAVNIGPGSFTGLRIGISAAKGFALMLDRPLVGVSALEAAAYAAQHTGYICPLIRAREDEYYYAVFSKEKGELTRITPDSVDSISNIEEILKAYSQVLRVTDLPNATSVACIGYKNQGDSCHNVVPSYLRVSQAERNREEKLRNGD